MTQNNLGNALKGLGEREDDAELLRQAVKAHCAALEIRTYEEMPLAWATTRNNLGDALRALSERESGTERLEAAAEAYSDALGAYERLGASHFAEIARRNLARAKALLAKRRGDAAAK